MTTRLIGLPLNGLANRTRDVILAFEYKARRDHYAILMDLKTHYRALASGCPCCGGTDMPCVGCVEAGR